MNTLSCNNVKQQLRDWLVAFAFAAFPDDRPSPIFPMYGAVINSIPLVWSCAMIPTGTCSPRYKNWACVGIANSFINMLFGVAFVFCIRRQVEKGISLDTPSSDVFLRYWLVKLFMAYVMWEMLWIIIAGVRSSEKADDVCRRHLKAQLSFATAYIVLGGLLFIFTFMTEWWKTPRWRQAAAVYWCEHHQPNGTNMDEDAGPLSPSRDGGEDAGNSPPSSSARRSSNLRGHGGAGRIEPGEGSSQRSRQWRATEVTSFDAMETLSNGDWSESSNQPSPSAHRSQNSRAGPQRAVHFVDEQMDVREHSPGPPERAPRSWESTSQSLPAPRRARAQDVVVDAETYTTEDRDAHSRRAR